MDKKRRIWVRSAIMFLGLVSLTLDHHVSAETTAVDLELVLAVDISGSVDDDEAALQRYGYIQAFRDPTIIEAITRGHIGAIAVTYMEWAGGHHQQFLVNWTRIHDAETAHDFADALAFEPITINVWTSISGALLAGTHAFERNPYKGRRRVIDISGDGANNDGIPVLVARERALATGLTINGLPIINDRLSRYGRRQIPNLDYFYIDCVVGGPGAFISVANGFEDYARAVRRKLILEIAGDVPSPNEKEPGIYLAQTGRPPCNVGEMLRQDWDDY